MHLIDRIGPVLGIVAFLGLAVLAFLVFQEAREVRRLREWAGRAPERAAEAEEATLAAAEAKGEGPEKPPGPWSRLRARLGSLRAGLAERLGPPMREVDRRLPMDPRYLFGALALLAVAAAVITSGFGFVGGGSSDHKGNGLGKHPRVAVLNGTQENGVPAVSGLAAAVAHGVVKPAGYVPKPVTDAPASVPQTTVVFRQGLKGPAKALAKKVGRKLGRTPTAPMSGAVRKRAGKSRLAVLIGLDDASFASGG